MQATWEYGYWISDMDVERFQGWHKAVTLGPALPSLLFFTLGIPALVAFLIGKRRQILYTGELDQVQFVPATHMQRSYVVVVCHLYLSMLTCSFTHPCKVAAISNSLSEPPCLL